MNISRRNLLAGASAGAALASVSPGLNVAFAADATPTTRDILIVVFQRGACDWLQMLAPAGDAAYVAARPNIRVRTSGNNVGIGLGTLGGTDFYLSGGAPELKTLYDAGSLAFVHATGIRTADRSHFLCQDMMEKGFSDTESKASTGWLTRHITSIGGARTALSTIANSSSSPMSLMAEASTISMSDAANFNVSGGANNTKIMRALNAGTTSYQKGATSALDAVDRVQTGLKTITDTSSTAGYTSGALSRPLRSLAKLIKMDVGVEVATVDFGGWDMHNSLVGEFSARTTEFSKAIAAFWTDVSAYQSRITLVTMTEFGRRLRENTSQGTDHGSASGMMVLGGSVAGGKIYGTWPGLAANQLTTGDLTVTTDYRQVLAEILKKRHAEPNLAAVFPSVTYNPLGFIK